MTTRGDKMKNLIKDIVIAVGVGTVMGFGLYNIVRDDIKSKRFINQNKEIIQEIKEDGLTFDSSGLEEIIDINSPEGQRSYHALQEFIELNEEYHKKFYDFSIPTPTFIEKYKIQINGEEYIIEVSHNQSADLTYELYKLNKNQEIYLGRLAEKYYSNLKKGAYYTLNIKWSDKEEYKELKNFLNEIGYFKNGFIEENEKRGTFRNKHSLAEIFMEVKR